MKRLLIVVLALGFLHGTGVAWAQESRQVSPSDVAAVDVYRDTMKNLKKDLQMAKTEVKQKNIALAQALGKLGSEYDPEVVKAVHKELMAAQQKLEMVVLKSFLIHKKYVPGWQPAAQGRPVSITTKRKPLKNDGDQPAL